MDYLKTVIYVDNVEETLDFYFQAFAVNTASLDDDGQYGELDFPHAKVAFAAHPLAQSHFKQSYIRSQPKQPALGFELVLSVDDLALAFAKAVEAGAEPLSAPCESEGENRAYVRSIEGTLVALIE